MSAVESNNQISNFLSTFFVDQFVNKLIHINYLTQKQYICKLNITAAYINHWYSSGYYDRFDALKVVSGRADVLSQSVMWQCKKWGALQGSCKCSWMSESALQWQHYKASVNGWGFCESLQCCTPTLCHPDKDWEADRLSAFYYVCVLLYFTCAGSSFVFNGFL